MTVTTTHLATDSFQTTRRAMVDSQLRTSGVNDEFVLARMLAVPRENHVPERARGTAYIDRAIPLDNGGRIAAPLFYGMVLTEAKPELKDVVLVIDAGSGYLPALIEPLVSKVDSIAPANAIGKSRKREVYSLILVDGAVENVSETLVNLLQDGGRIVTGLASGGVTRLAIGRKSRAGIAMLPLADIGIPRLSEFDTPASWSF